MLVTFLSFIFAMVGHVHAQSGGVAETRLLARSSSGNTAIFNVGELDHVKVGDHGVVMRRIAKQDAPELRVIHVANARVIRVSRTRSLWFIYDIKDPAQIILREPYLVTTESMSLNGRRRLQNERLKVVDEKEDLPTYLSDKREGDKNTLAIRKDEYIPVKRAHKLSESWEKDGVLHDIDEWVSADKAGQQKYAKALWRSQSESDFADNKRLDTFHKVVANYLTRVNDPAFNYGDFYWEQTKDASGQFRVQSSNQTAYQQFLDEEKKRMSKDTELYRELLDKGQSWSADYSDEELSSMLDKVGVIYERERRRTATIRSYNFQLMGNLGFNMLDNENRADSANSRKAKWNLEIGAEWYPAPKHESAQKLALWASTRYVEDGVSIGALNARTQEYSFAGGLTWHPLNSPFTLNTNVPFISLGVRTGVVQLSTPSNGDQANYSLLSFPVLTAGIKYAFRSGVGLRVAGSVEKLLLEQTQANQTTTGLPTREEILDGRLSFGITKFF